MTTPQLLHGIRVLVVDDEPLVREAAQAILALYGADASTAGSAALGLAQAASAGGTPDVVLLDLGLPDASPADLRSAWIAACPSAAVIVMTGADASQAQEAVFGTGWSLLLKPFGAEELVEAVGRALGHPLRSS